MRWRRRRDPIPDRHLAWPDHGRDPEGRQFDGDRVRPEGWPGWEADLLAAEVTEAAMRALDGPTQIHARPLMTRGQQYRGNGGRS